MELTLNFFQTTGFACILLIIGNFLRNNISFLENFAIPPAVIGGFLFSFINLILRETNVLIIDFDTTLKIFLCICSLLVLVMELLFYF